jgi:hypothetical protein
VDGLRRTGLLLRGCGNVHQSKLQGLHKHALHVHSKTCGRLSTASQALLRTRVLHVQAA